MGGPPSLTTCRPCRRSISIRTLPNSTAHSIVCWIPGYKLLGRAMMGFDGLAGVVVFALEGRPVGEARYGGRDPDFYTDYRLLAPTEDFDELNVYVPAGENIVPTGGES